MAKQLTAAESVERWGQLMAPIGYPVSIRLEIEEGEETWAPIYDSWMVWQGYELME